MAQDTTGSKWLTLTAEAVLHVVPAANYLRYGPVGVRRFGPNAIAQTEPHPHTVLIQLAAKNPRGDVLFEYGDWLLHHTEPEQAFDLEGTTLWAGVREAEHVRIMWVWDFYRMYSGIRLEVQQPESPAADSAEQNDPSPWQRAYRQLAALAPGDQLVVRVASASGHILQVYPINRSPLETT